MSNSTAVMVENEGAARPARPVRRGWKTTGWQGLTLQTPSEWNLVAYSGDRNVGSLRLDNGETGAALGIDLRWSTPKGKITDADLEKRLDQYFAGIVKTAKRQRITAETRSKAISQDRHPERDAARSFSWKADRKASGRIWHCTECGRLVIAQVVGTGGEGNALAGDVLQSLACHPAESGWQIWSLYDLLTQMPPDYALRGKPQLMNIYVQLAFGLGQSLDTVTVEQWGVANVQLRGMYLDEWFRSKNRAQEASLRYETGEATAHGHPALTLTGRRAGIAYWAGQALPQIVKLHRPAYHYAGCAWECPESNKIYLVQSFSRRPQPDLVREIVARTACHE